MKPEQSFKDAERWVMVAPIGLYGPGWRLCVTIKLGVQDREFGLDRYSRTFCLYYQLSGIDILKENTLKIIVIIIKAMCLSANLDF